MNEQLVFEAKSYLDHLYESLPLEKSGEELLNSIEKRIRSYKDESYDAIRAAIGIWLRGEHERKARYAIDLIGRLHLTEYLNDLEELRGQMIAGSSTLPTLWLSFVDAIILELRGK